ncbi:glycoside hydrolase family 9 protein [Streptacidiphilus sp. P02-A3a]|uniref:glycoside hydrolase family 9 protein n=1 Tax=Streptacidiphilus sp. P02-A3a TaxID=2704468 RepID=UPI0015FBE98D|nr:glycoside hydrolase family 9 protein [Streptacidiphilus sp. P02-A3a]QMU70914.1 glycoside hydrolase [Streptacidiphilus sp. P02-A3a]
MRSSIRRPDLRTLLALAVGTGLVTAVVPLASAAAATTGQLRVDQVGYGTSDTKIAYLMTTAAVSGETYKLVNSAGTAVASGSVTTSSRGSWNSAYPDVYPIDFSTVTTAGTYHVVTSGTVAATSDTFQIEAPSTLYGGLVSAGVNFFQNQRDGADVITGGALNRQPAHLNDASATVYQTPDFIANSDGDTGDQISGNLTPISGASPVNVEGGWFDAGDYLKFTFTASYADDLLYASDLALGSNAPASLTAEAQYGTSWLNKMYNASTKTLYLQVGIGEGNESSYGGDHDLWRLPQADDSDSTAYDKYAAKNRPVFEAAAPGAKIDPDVVGRVAAAFAFAAQADAKAGDTADAATELANATSLYAQANTSPSGTLETADPEAYYPESIWHDAMELGATEIALAQQDLGDSSATYTPYLTQAGTWASDYIASDSGQDTLNLYDVSAIAHADLITALKNAGNPSVAVTPAALIANLKAQVASAATVSAADIFHEGGDYTNFDVDSHTFGFISTEALYQKASGDTEYAAFANEQRDWLLGDNAWGTSFMVGEGTTFPDCMGSQIPNILGNSSGTGAIDTGAVVNGPNGSSNFSGGLGGLLTGMVKCENDSYTTFTGHGSEYVDDVRSWQSSEPALDMSGSAVLAGALQGALGGGGGGQPGNDFSVAVSPASGSVAAGGSATATVSTAVASGSAEPVALTASGLPSGVTASFAPASVSSGTGSTLTLATTSATAAGSYPVTVTGTAASGSHTTSYTLTVTGSGGSPGGRTYEADQATLGGSADANSCSACLDGQKVSDIGGGSNGTVTFTGITEPSTGSYTLTVSYLSVGKARPATITVNGTTQTVTFAETSASSYNVIGTTTVTVTLNAGSGNTVEFSGSGTSGAPDLDHIVV